MWWRAERSRADGENDLLWPRADQAEAGGRARANLCGEYTGHQWWLLKSPESISEWGGRQGSWKELSLGNQKAGATLFPDP